MFELVSALCVGGAGKEAVEAPQVRYVVCFCILYWCVVPPLLVRQRCYLLVPFTCALPQCDVTKGGT